MAEIRMGWREGNGKGKEIKVAPNQYFHRRGGHFVHLHNGLASLCASGAPKIAGWLEPPKDTDGKSSWKSSSTSGKDKCYVVTGVDNVFCMPVHELNASISDTLIGRGAGIWNTGATHALIQKCKLGTVTASLLSIVDVDTVNKLVYVRVKLNKIQAI